MPWPGQQRRPAHTTTEQVGCTRTRTRSRHTPVRAAVCAVTACGDAPPPQNAVCRYAALGDRQQASTPCSQGTGWTCTAAPVLALVYPPFSWKPPGPRWCMPGPTHLARRTHLLRQGWVAAGKQELWTRPALCTAPRACRCWRAAAQPRNAFMVFRRPWPGKGGSGGAPRTSQHERDLSGATPPIGHAFAAGWLAGATPQHTQEDGRHAYQVLPGHPSQRGAPDDEPSRIPVGLRVRTGRHTHIQLAGRTASNVSLLPARVQGHGTAYGTGTACGTGTGTRELRSCSGRHTCGRTTPRRDAAGTEPGRRLGLACAAMR